MRGEMRGKHARSFGCTKLTNGSDGNLTMAPDTVGSTVRDTTVYYTYAREYRAKLGRSYPVGPGGLGLDPWRCKFLTMGRIPPALDPRPSAHPDFQDPESTIPPLLDLAQNFTSSKWTIGITHEFLDFA